MRTQPPSAVAAFLLPPLLALAGCTLYAAGTPTIATTTSAEQTQRIFWDDVRAHKWQAVRSLLTANTTWRNGAAVLSRDEIVMYLQQLQLKDVLLSNFSVKPNANDMTVTYDIQWSTASAPTVNLHAVAIWQQLPPLPPNASKKEKKQAAGNAPYLLVLEDLAPDTPAR